ncbi:MAG: pilus assembly protein PilM [Candidatus Edwardsbacteria bacterium]|nr:pilus assembly protein PilM [Candidatus Edwardsbacteria bacterium]
MMPSFLAKKYVGLDIGPSCVKIAVLTAQGNRLAVQSLIRAPLDRAHGLPSEGERNASIAETIRAAFAGLDPGLRRVATNLSGAYAVSRTFTLPVMPRSELLRHIVDNAPKYLPVGTEIEDMIIDVQIQRETISSGQEAAQVILAVGRKEMIQIQLSLLEQAGLYPSCLDASAISLFNAVALHPAVLSGKTVAVVEIGHSQAKVMVIRDGMLSFITELTHGSRMIDDRLRENRDLNDEQIINLKRHLSSLEELPANGEESVTGAGVPFTELQTMLEDFNKQTAQEISRVRKFLKDESAWEQVILTGGAAAIPGLAQVIRQEIGCPAEVLKTIPGVIAGPSQRDQIPEFSLAIGLALKKVQQDVNRINLIPPHEQTAIDDRWHIFLSHLVRDRIAVGLIGVSFVLALAWSFLIGLSWILQKKAEALSGQYYTARSSQTLNQQLKHRYAVLGNLANTGLEPDRLMQEISRLAPPEILLTSIRTKTRMNPGEDQGQVQTAAEMQLEGESVSSQSLATFIGSLEKSARFGMSKFEIRKKQRTPAPSPGLDAGEAVEFNIDLTVKQ